MNNILLLAIIGVSAVVVIAGILTYPVNAQFQQELSPEQHEDAINCILLKNCNSDYGRQILNQVEQSTTDEIKQKCYDIIKKQPEIKDPEVTVFVCVHLLTELKYNK